VSGDRLTKSTRFCERLSELYKDVEVAETLLPFGVTRSELPFMVEQAMLLKHAIDFNPVYLAPADIETILASLV
jgi:alcohol dehydrogenase class IV